MLSIPLARLAKAKRPRLKRITAKPTAPTATMAGDLYRAAYQPIINAWDDVIPALLAAYETTIVRDALVADAVSDVQNVLAASALAFDRLTLRLTADLRDWTIRAERWQRQKWRGSILTATGVDLDTMMTLGDVSETVEAFIARNTALITKVSAEAQARASDIVFRGAQENRPVRDVAKELRESVEMSRRRSINIAADQNQKLAARLDQARQEQAGGEKFEWLQSGKLHPRAKHVARNHKVYEWSDPAVKDDLPGYAPFCGCRAGFVLELD